MSVGHALTPLSPQIEEELKDEVIDFIRDLFEGESNLELQVRLLAAERDLYHKLYLAERSAEEVVENFGKAAEARERMKWLVEEYERYHESFS